jgi:hypothetical protein
MNDKANFGSRLERVKGLLCFRFFAIFRTLISTCREPTHCVKNNHFCVYRFELIHVLNFPIVLCLSMRSRYFH